MLIHTKITPSLKLSAIMVAIRGAVINDFVATILLLIVIGVALTQTVPGGLSGPLAHSWSVWGFGL